MVCVKWGANWVFVGTNGNWGASWQAAHCKGEPLKIQRNIPTFCCRKNLRIQCKDHSTDFLIGSVREIKSRGMGGMAAHLEGQAFRYVHFLPQINLILRKYCPAIAKLHLESDHRVQGAAGCQTCESRGVARTSDTRSAEDDRTASSRSAAHPP